MPVTSTLQEKTTQRRMTPQDVPWHEQNVNKLKDSILRHSSSHTDDAAKYQKLIRELMRNNGSLKPDSPWRRFTSTFISDPKLRQQNHLDAFKDSSDASWKPEQRPPDTQTQLPQSHTEKIFLLTERLISYPPTPTTSPQPIPEDSPYSSDFQPLKETTIPPRSTHISSPLQQFYHRFLPHTHLQSQINHILDKYSITWDDILSDAKLQPEHNQQRLHFLELLGLPLFKDGHDFLQSINNTNITANINFISQAIYHLMLGYYQMIMCSSFCLKTYFCDPVTDHLHLDLYLSCPWNFSISCEILIIPGETTCIKQWSGEMF